MFIIFLKLCSPHSRESIISSQGISNTIVIISSAETSWNHIPHHPRESSLVYPRAIPTHQHILQHGDFLENLSLIHVRASLVHPGQFQNPWASPWYSHHCLLRSGTHLESIRIHCIPPGSFIMDVPYSRRLAMHALSYNQLNGSPLHLCHGCCTGIQNNSRYVDPSSY